MDKEVRLNGNRYPIIQGKQELMNYNQLSWIYEQIETLVDLMDDKAIAEITSGTEKDLEGILNVIEQEAIQIFTSIPEPVTESKFYELTALTRNLDESLKVLNYNYFKSTMLPEFHLGAHSIEWGNFVQLYQFVCILASRGLGKSFEMSFAYPLWKMYGYRRGTELAPISRQTALNKNGVLVTNKYSLGKDLLKIITDEIKVNELLWDKLKPSSGGLGKEEIECKNGATMKLRSYDSSIRGLHPGWITVDDFLVKECMYSKETREKYTDVFQSEIMQAIEPDGQVVCIGCVNPDTIVLTKDGLRTMKEVSPLGDISEKKTLVEIEVDLFGRKDFNKSSHYWYNGLTETKKISLEYGFEIECSHIHPLWKMFDNGVPKWEKSENLSVNDYVAIKIGAGFGEAKPVSLIDYKKTPAPHKNFNIPDCLNEELCYLIGLWVADGSSEKCGRITITKYNKRIQDRVINNNLGIDFKIRQEGKMQVQMKRLYDLFEYIGVKFTTAKNKDVPDKIFHSNEETLIWFLRGLYDGDGCCSINERGGIQINLSSISESLIVKVQQVLLQMGMVASRMKRPPGISKKVVGKHDVHILVLSGIDAKNFIKKIGFVSSGKMDKITMIDDIIFNEESNCHHIPHQKELIKGARIEKPRRERGKVSLLPPFNGQEVLNPKIRRSSLITAYNWFYENKARGENMNQIYRNIEDNLVYLRIKKIKNSSCLTVDFHIPNKHEFLTNGVLSHNTPFHHEDLYSVLRKDPKWRLFEYPAIFPDGELAAPNRYTYELIEEKRKSLGSLIFSREILVVPVSDVSTIFPWSILENSFKGMHDFKLVTNIHSHPVKFKRVTVGCDFALSANIGADSSVFSVWGLDQYNEWWLLHVWRGHGKSHNEQLSKIAEIERNFDPNEIIMETNGFQRVMADLARERGVRNIIEFNTNKMNKKDFYDGLPSLAVLFEQSRIKMPRGDAYSKEQTDWLLGEFNSITIKEDGKLESASEHDDGVMSTFFALKGGESAKINKFEFGFA